MPDGTGDSSGSGSNRPLKRHNDVSEDKARTQALLLSNGAARRSLDGHVRHNEDHPLTQRCREWGQRSVEVDRAREGRNTTPANEQFPPVKKGSDSDTLHHTCSQLSPQATSQLTTNLEKHSGVKPYGLDSLDPDQFDIEDFDPDVDLQKQVDGWNRLQKWVDKDQKKRERI